MGISQNDSLEILLNKGEKAFLNNDYKLAKELYYNATKIDPKNSIAWYNLAASEMQLSDSINACEHLFKVYSLNNFDVIKDIKKYCSKIGSEDYKFMNEVHEPPKFIYKGKECNFFINKNEFNSKYYNIIYKEIKKSKIIFAGHFSGYIYFSIKFNSNNLEFKFISHIPDNTQEKINEIQIKEFIKIFENNTIYIPAKYNNKNINIIETFLLPIRFQEIEFKNEFTDI